jgi:hypothetical protein
MRVSKRSARVRKLADFAAGSDIAFLLTQCTADTRPLQGGPRSAHAHSIVPGGLLLTFEHHAVDGVDLVDDPPRHPRENAIENG